MSKINTYKCILTFGEKPKMVTINSNVPQTPTFFKSKVDKCFKISIKEPFINEHVFLQTWLNNLKSFGIEFVSISDITNIIEANIEIYNTIYKNKRGFKKMEL